MDGRLERENKIDKSINKKLESLPRYVADWNRNLRASRKTAATRKDFIYKVDHFLRFINDDPKSVACADITEQSVADYMLSIQTKMKDGQMEYTSDSYQRTVWSCLNSLFEYLCNCGKMEKNYIKIIEPPKNRDLERINEHRILLTSDDFKKILQSVADEKNPNIRKRDKAILLVFMNTGMRRAALSNIATSDVDINEGMLTVVDKGNKRHQYFLNDDVKKAIYDWLGVRHRFLNHNRNSHLFLSSRGEAMSDRAIDYLVKKYTELALGRAISPHKLRSGYCSILYEKTHDIEFVRRAVGHSSAVTTQRYIVTNGTEKKKAAEIMGNLLT